MKFKIELQFLCILFRKYFFITFVIFFNKNTSQIFAFFKEKLSFSMYKFTKKLHAANFIFNVKIKIIK